MKEGIRQKVVEIIIRASIMALCIVLAVVFGEEFDTVLSIVGNIFCVPLSFLLPALLHFKLVAVTKSDKVRDIVLVCFGALCMVSIIVLMVIDYT
jgi:proton-coupled amino acid transporter